MSKPSKRAGAPGKIKISQSMIDAGVEVLDRYRDEALTLDHLVVRVFRAMCEAHPFSSIKAIDVTEYSERVSR